MMADHKHANSVPAGEEVVWKSDLSEKISQKENVSTAPHAGQIPQPAEAKIKSKKKNIKVKPEDHQVLLDMVPDESVYKRSKIPFYYKDLKKGMETNDEFAECCLGVSMGQFRVIQKLIKQHPVLSKVMHADDPEMLSVHTMAPLKHLAGLVKYVVSGDCGITVESIDFDLIALKTIFPPINLPFTEQQLLANVKDFSGMLKLPNCLGLCWIVNLTTDPMAEDDAEDDPPQEHFKVLVVANGKGRLDYVETFPGSQTDRKCLEASKFYKELLHQIPASIEGRFTCSFKMAPTGETKEEEPFLRYTQYRREVEEVAGQRYVDEIIDEAATWFPSLTKYREGPAKEFGGAVELIFRIMNAKAANFLGAGSGKKKEKEEEIIPDKQRRELRHRMKLFIRQIRD